MRYSIESQSPEGNWFSINAQTGEMKLEEELDYEQLTQISVGIMAEDQAQGKRKSPFGSYLNFNNQRSDVLICFVLFFP